MFNFLRIAVASVVLIVALVIVHKWLPAGRRPVLTIAPGIVATLLLWLLAGELFGDYLARFAYTYVTYYAGLASAMIALVFLYVIATIFILGGELNAAIVRWREAEPRGHRIGGGVAITSRLRPHPRSSSAPGAAR